MTDDSIASRVDRIRKNLQSDRVTQDRVELAAYCGDDAAAFTLGKTDNVESIGNEEWAQGLHKWGGIVMVRAVVALARRFQCDWKPGVGKGDLEQGICAVERWVVCPCDEHRGDAVDCRITAGGWGWFNRSAQTIPERATMKARRAGMAAEMAALAIEELDRPGTHVNFWPQVWKLTLPLPWLKRSENPATLKSAITTELIPWALGESDPVVERVSMSKGRGEK